MCECPKGTLRIGINSGKNLLHLFRRQCKHSESTQTPAFSKWQKSMLLALQVLETILKAHLGNTSSLQEWRLERENNIHMKQRRNTTICIARKLVKNYIYIKKISQSVEYWLVILLSVASIHLNRQAWIHDLPGGMRGSLLLLFHLLLKI